MHEAPDTWSNLTELRELARPEVLLPPARPRVDRRAVKRVLLLVVLPTLLVSLYFGVFAADRYVSSARFVVHTPNSVGPITSASSMITFTPITEGDTDSYAVREYLTSRDALALLEQKLPLRAMLARADRDPFWAYPSLFHRKTNKGLYRYFRSLISVSYNDGTSITSLNVEAFRPEDAERIATVLMGGAEAMLNRMNQRSRENALKVATDEVANSRAATLAAQDALTAYRDREHVVDPVAYSETVLKTIATLMQDLVNTSAQLDVTVHSSPRSPQIPLLRSRMDALQAEIGNEHAVLAGSDRSLAPRIAGYERLVLLRNFAEQRYVSALALQDSARLDAERQAAYLEPVVSPRAPDQPTYPYRVLWPIVTLFVGLLTCWLFRPMDPAPPRTRL